MYKIKKSDLPALFEKIGSQKELFVPVKRAGQVNFGPWKADEEVDLDTLKAVKSPKDIFFPQCETLYSCRRDGQKLSIDQQALQDQSFVVFGMRGCDVKGLEVLDRVFLTDPVDTFYQARREHGVIVAMACHRPETSCFCSVFGNDAANPAADVAAWIVEETLYWQPVTEKGKALTEELSGLLTDAGADGEAAVEQEKENIHAIVEKLPYTGLSLDAWKNVSELERFGSPLWEELYKPCLGCGTCTFVCPTCQCYDIRDFNTGSEVKRFRCWDSCMYSDFTLMAAENSRTSQMQRFRQRFMHKLVYFPANNDGIYSCVGCGRCVDKCPSSLNIVKVIKKFAAAQAEAKVGGADNE